MATRVLVTGAGGFIGSHLVERLVRDGNEVRAFVHYNGASNYYNLERFAPDVRSQVEVVPGDLLDPFCVDRAVQGCEVVFHLGALVSIPYSYEAPALYFSTNVLGTVNVMQASLRHGVRRLLHTSTSEVYGTAQYVPIDEVHPLVGQSPYSASKIAADKAAESFWLSFALPVVTVRPFNTYGPRQSGRAIIPTIAAQALTRDNLSLGSLDTIRDLTYVDDTVAGFVAASQAPGVEGHTVNLGVGTGYSIAEIVEMIRKLLAKPLPVSQDPARMRPANSEVRRLISNNSRALELLGWQPQVSLEVGLRRTLDFVREHLAEFKAEVYCV